MKAYQKWIDQLGLLPHPEGGFYKETYRCQEHISAVHLPDRFDQAHCFSTAIYYLLNAPNFSAFHRIKQDELWHFYQGRPLTIHVINASGNYQKMLLGDDPSQGQSFQHVVKAGDWFAASVDDENYALVGCTVAPGFEFNDFELAKKNELLSQYPQHKSVIASLCIA
ncbi:cupin domain-containing protein [Marinicella rhabdoformis]|uniref:cupin domain-containing protein n=1 Tax=Marinicella rhabdoformis TaxID=2580566 RepID=UPI0012AECC30|nr:cupin domain-containing protein [Marinicella rhabdoformis]